MNNKNYTNYNIDDFVWDESFRNWVLHPDIESDFFWRNWLASHPYREPDIMAATNIIKSFRTNNQAITDEAISEAIANVMFSIDTDRTNISKSGLMHIRIKQLTYISIAASLILLTGLAFYFNKITINKSPVTYYDLVKNANEELIETTNNTKKPLVLKLLDGSTIILEKKASISIARSFNNYPDRKVYLTGEATFEVARNIEKPFFVYANSLVTKVLGTRFKIRSYVNEEKTTVEVQSGLVAVYSFVDVPLEDENLKKNLNRILLTRNQKASYSTENKTLMATIVETPVIAKDKEINYHFADASLDKVFNLIKEGYGIEIIYDEKMLANRTITANLEDQGLYQKLDIICKTINSHYEIIDGNIVIYSHNLLDQ